MRLYAAGSEMSSGAYESDGELNDPWRTTRCVVPGVVGMAGGVRDKDGTSSVTGVQRPYGICEDDDGGADGISEP